MRYPFVIGVIFGAFIAAAALALAGICLCP